MLNMKKSVVITGANRGIGLSFVKLYLKRGWYVYATVRSSAGGLDVLKTTYPDQLKTLTLDTGNTSSIAKLREQIDPNAPIHLLINNAGIYAKESTPLTNATEQDLEKIHQGLLSQFQVNAIGPLFVSATLMPHLLKDASNEHPTKIVHITSRMGSIQDNTSGHSHGYRASKCALNMFTKCQAVEFSQSDLPVSVIALHPGFIQTDMTHSKGDMGPDEAVERMVKVIDTMDMSHRGKFFHRDGQELPW